MAAIHSKIFGKRRKSFVITFTIYTDTPNIDNHILKKHRSFGLWNEENKFLFLCWKRYVCISLLLKKIFFSCYIGNNNFVDGQKSNNYQGFRLTESNRSHPASVKWKFSVDKWKIAKEKKNNLKKKWRVLFYIFVLRKLIQIMKMKKRRRK